jgi:hypothetical protein
MAEPPCVTPVTGSEKALQTTQTAIAPGVKPPFRDRVWLATLAAAVPLVLEMRPTAMAVSSG